MFVFFLFQHGNRFAFVMDAAGSGVAYTSIQHSVSAYFVLLRHLVEVIWMKLRSVNWLIVWMYHQSNCYALIEVDCLTAIVRHWSLPALVRGYQSDDFDVA